MTTSVLVSGSYFPPQVGGISSLMAEICGALGPRAVAVLTGVPDEVDDPRIAGLKIYRRPRAFNQRAIGHPLWLASAMAQVLVREKPRVLQYATSEDAFIAWWAYRTLGVPYVIYAHGNEILSVIAGGWEKSRQALRSAARVVANSRYTAALVAAAGVDPRRIEIVHPGCDVQRFAPREADEDTKRALLGPRWNDRVILTVGNLVERKGHDVAIMALSRVISRVPNVCYVIAGDGPHRSALEGLVRRLGLQDRVLFAGRIHEEQLPVYYSVCDVFVMPARARVEHNDVEGFGIVFLEAGACGKPCIGGRSGGIEDAILDDRTGLLVDPGDPEQLAAAIESLLLNPQRAKEFGSRARERVAAEHNWRRVGTRLREIIDAVSAEKR